MKLEQIQEFADRNNFGKVVKVQPWNGYECYDHYVAEDEEPPCVGEPIVILVRGYSIRFSTSKEAFERLRAINSQPSS